MTSGPQRFQIWTVLFTVVWFLLGQELIGGGLAPQSRLQLSGKSADLERFSDLVNNPESVLSSVFVSGLLLALPAYDSATLLCVLLVTFIIYLGPLKLCLKNVIKNSKLFDFLPLLFKGL